MNVKERILQFLSSQHISQGRFEQRCGLSNGYINALKKNPGAEKLQRILGAYPELNREWLLTGEGEMLNPNSSEIKANAKMIGEVYSADQRDEGVVMVDFVPISATASFIESLEGVREMPLDKYPLIPRDGERENIELFKIFEVEGDSMFPTISSGSLILAKEIPEKSWHYAEGVVVAIFNEYVVVKRVARNSLLTENIIILRSDNESYGEMTVALNDLRGLFKAKRIISSEIR